MDKSCKGLVQYVLENEIEARNDDELLIALVDALTNANVVGMKYIEVAKKRSSYGLYPIESITRARREIQEDNPELRGVDWVTRRRARREKMVRAYYHDKKNGKR